MRIVQISDFHIEPEGVLAYRVADTRTSFEAAIAHLTALPQRPDAVVITGDIASSGREEAYRFARQGLDKLAALGMAVYVLPGNHDHRGRMLDFLAPYCPADPAVAPWLCYAVDAPELRLVCLDSMQPGSHSGHLTPEVTQWLDRTLAAAPGKDTLLFCHHPPFLAGMGAMDEAYEGRERLAEILRAHPDVRLCCGHMHRAFSTLWMGRLCLCAPAASMQLNLHLAPEGGDDFVMEAPGYLLHHHTGEYCNSHVCQIPGSYSYSGPHPFVGVINPV